MIKILIGLKKIMVDVVGGESVIKERKMFVMQFNVWRMKSSPDDDER